MKEWKIFSNSHPKILRIYVKKILGACKLNILDKRGNQFPTGWSKPPQKRGGLEYFPSDSNWVGYWFKSIGAIW